MKIIYFNYMADLYGYSIGSTIKAIKLFGALEKRGHTVSMHWLVKQNNQSGATEEQKKARGWRSLARKILFTPKYLLKNIPQLFREIRILKSEKGDVLITRLDAFRISALWAARLYQLPLIVEADGASSYEWLTFNNGPHLWNKALLWCEKVMLSRASGVFTQSNEAKDYFIRQHGIAANKIIVITNGADELSAADEKSLRLLRGTLGIEQGNRVIGFLGSMHHWHGVADVPQLIDKVLAQFDDALFLFVGKGGALEMELRQKLSGKYAKRVIFTGHVDNDKAPDYVRLFTVAIAPYPKIDLFYFSPMKVFEYMAAGKAIIASRIGQITEVLHDDKSAVLYDPGNISELQEKLVDLLRDESRRIKLGENARQIFLQGYTWAHKAKELEQFLQTYTL